MCCKDCEMFNNMEPIKIIDKKYDNPFMQDIFHFENGFKCLYNGIESLNAEDLKKGNCRCRGE